MTSPELPQLPSETSADEAPVDSVEVVTPAVADIAIADGVWHSLDPRSVRLNRTVRWLRFFGTTLLSLSVVVGVYLLVEGPAWLHPTVWSVWAAGTLLRMWHSHAWPLLEYKHASYKVDAQGIEIRIGVLFRSVSNVPRSRVQHTDVSQGPIERNYGLARLIVHTAGTVHAVVVLGGLDHGTAMRIREHLLPREGDDAV